MNNCSSASNYIRPVDFWTEVVRQLDVAGLNGATTAQAGP